jgi:Cytochrome P460
MRSLLLVAAASAAAVASVPARGDLTPPTGYRHWFHVNSSLVDSGSPLFSTLGGLHNIYLNAVGQPALASGASYPDGSIFVDEIRDFTASNHTYSAGGRKGLAVMVKDAKQHAATGGWGFQLWAGGDAAKPLVTDAVTQCFGCHTSQQDHQYVFSTYLP